MHKWLCLFFFIPPSLSLLYLLLHKITFFATLRIPQIFNPDDNSNPLPQRNRCDILIRNKREREKKLLAFVFFPFAEFIFVQYNLAFKANRSCNFANIQFFMQIKVCFPTAHRISTFLPLFLSFSLYSASVFDNLYLMLFWFPVSFRSFWIAIFQLYFIAHLFIHLTNQKIVIFRRKECKAKKMRNEVRNIQYWLMKWHSQYVSVEYHSQCMHISKLYVCKMLYRNNRITMSNLQMCEM